MKEEQQTLKHRCALCDGRGKYSNKRRDKYIRIIQCKRCKGVGRHDDRKVKAKPLAKTEL